MSPCRATVHIYYMLYSWIYAGLGLDALEDNGITKKLLYVIQDRRLRPDHEPWRRVRKPHIVMFASVELMGSAATFAITQTTGSPSLRPVVHWRLLDLRN